jgi:hypothetical protein
MTAVLLGGNAFAGDIYTQTFVGGNKPIVGTTSTTGGGNWAGSNIINLDGNSTEGDGAISLPFTPQSGFIYDLTATINVTAPNSSWIGVGFLESNTTYGFLGTKITPALLNTGAWQTWAGPGYNSIKTSNEVRIRLDTTGALWTVAFFQGATQMGSTYTYTAGNPTINYVGFIAEGPAVGEVSAFKLTATASTVNYSQTFNGGTGALVGTASTTGGGIWEGPGILNLNGAVAGGGADSLAFIPTSGFVYDLTATINTTSGAWIGVGFLQLNTTYGFLPDGGKTTPTLLNTTTQWQAWAGPGDNYNKTSNDVLIRLDTRASEWTATFYQRDAEMEYTQMGQTYTYTDGNPTINYVGFVAEGPAVGNVSAFRLTTVSNSPTFATWATTNAGGQAANLDWDNDGVPNAVEFFMNAAPGFTPNPGPVDNTVTWINGGNIPSSAYGTAFVVQSSIDLVTWTDIPGNDPNLVNTSNSVAYTFSVSGVGKQFIRLKLTLN